jgi:hypothetical protein
MIVNGAVAFGLPRFPAFLLPDEKKEHSDQYQQAYDIADHNWPGKFFAVFADSKKIVKRQHAHNNPEKPADMVLIGKQGYSYRHDDIICNDQEYRFGRVIVPPAAFKYFLGQ